MLTHALQTSERPTGARRRFPYAARTQSLAAGLGVSLLVLTAGCGDRPPADTAPLDLRGKPIRERPVAPAPTAQTNPVAPPAPASNAASFRPLAPLPPLAPAAPTGVIDGFQQVGFDLLSGFPFDVPFEPLTNATEQPLPPGATIPPTVRALDATSVALKGFMLPLKVQGGLVTEMLIMRDQSMCCFGVVPKLNEWVSVKMRAEGVKPIMDQAVTIFGTLRVGAVHENGYLVGIYTMEGERLAGPLDL